MRPKLSENLDKQDYFEFARSILQGENLSDKFQNYQVDWGRWRQFEIPKYPSRYGKISFSDQQLKFPKVSRLNEVDKKAMALHSFANHELLAIEMMACAILIYPHQTDEDIRFKKGILTALKEEQKHLRLYIGRLNQLGYELGDFPLNDFFWRQMHKLETPNQYTAVMAMTFEAANLDFANFYSKLFRSMGDEETAKILDIVLDDEIGHVAFGVHWMKKWSSDKSLWEYYVNSLPWPLTPARSKGINYDEGLRQIAINDSDFIKSLSNFDDLFKITKRS